jgi:hypothetical protein
MIKIMIKRKAPKDKEAELLSLITQLRIAAAQQPDTSRARLSTGPINPRIIW